MEHDEFGLHTSRRVRASDLRRATGVPGRTGGKVKYDVAHPSMECQATVVEQRKACTKGQPESAEAERQRQKGQQAQQQRKGDDSCGSEGGNVRMQRRCDQGSSLHSEREGQGRKKRNKRARSKKKKKNKKEGRKRRRTSGRSTAGSGRHAEKGRKENMRDDGRQTTRWRETHEASNCHIVVIFQLALFFQMEFVHVECTCMFQRAQSKGEC